MTFSSSLANNLSPLIFDISVLINLHASKYGLRILNALPNQIFIPDIVESKLRNSSKNRNNENQYLCELIDQSKIKILTLNNQEYELYEKLLLYPSSLDDTEAVTIAVAATRHILPIFDGARAQIQAEKYYKENIPIWSLDLFRHPQVITTLGQIESIQALYFALHYGHMRIPEDLCDQVVDLIGVELALQCPCLPNFKSKRQGWLLHIDQLKRQP